MRITEHLMFAALMAPTILLLTAAAVSLSHPEPKAIKVAAAAPGCRLRPAHSRTEPFLSAMAAPEYLVFVALLLPTLLLVAAAILLMV